MPADGLRPQAEGAVRFAAAAGVQRHVGVQQVADEVILDPQVALVDLGDERQLVHVLQHRAVLVVLDHAVGVAEGDAVDSGPVAALGDFLDGEVEFVAGHEVDRRALHAGSRPAAPPPWRRRSRSSAPGWRPSAPLPPSRRRRTRGWRCGSRTARAGAPRPAPTAGRYRPAARRSACCPAPARPAEPARSDTRSCGSPALPGSASRRRRRTRRTMGAAGKASSSWRSLFLRGVRPLPAVPPCPQGEGEDFPLSACSVAPRQSTVSPA